MSTKSAKLTHQAVHVIVGNEVSDVAEEVLLFDFSASGFDTKLLRLNPKSETLESKLSEQSKLQASGQPCPYLAFQAEETAKCATAALPLYA